MLKNKTPYHDIGAEQYQEKYRQRQIRNLRRQARRLGFCLEPVTAQEMGS